MWAGSDEEREQIRQAGLELMPGELLAAATTTGADLEGITAVLLLTDEDDFNALAATVLTGNPETRAWPPAIPPTASSPLSVPATRSSPLPSPAKTSATATTPAPALPPSQPTASHPTPTSCS
jgi:hypothetical protein